MVRFIGTSLIVGGVLSLVCMAFGVEVAICVAIIMLGVQLADC